jgi:hypothetical protein
VSLDHVRLRNTGRNTGQGGGTTMVVGMSQDAGRALIDEVADSSDPGQYLIDATIRPMLLPRVAFRNATRARHGLRVEK